MANINHNKKSYKNPYGKASIDEPVVDNMGKFTITAIIVFFISCIYLLLHIHQVELSTLGFFKILDFFLGHSFLILIKWYRKLLTMSMYEYIIFNLISIAPLLFTIFLLINNVFAGKPYIETYKIEHAVLNNENLCYVLEGNPYEDAAYIRTLYREENHEYDGSDSLSITFADGFFGIRQIKKKRLH